MTNTKGCGKSFEYTVGCGKKGTPEYRYSQSNNCGNNDQNIVCPECETKQKMINMAIQQIDEWWCNVDDNEIKRLKQRIRNLK